MFQLVDHGHDKPGASDVGCGTMQPATVPRKILVPYGPAAARKTACVITVAFVGTVGMMFLDVCAGGRP